MFSSVPRPRQPASRITVSASDRYRAESYKEISGYIKFCMVDTKTWVKRIAKSVVVVWVACVTLSFLLYFILGQKIDSIGRTKTILFTINSIGSKVILPTIVVLFIIFLMEKGSPNSTKSTVPKEGSDSILNKIFRVAITPVILWILICVLGILLIIIAGMSRNLGG